MGKRIRKADVMMPCGMAGYLAMQESLRLAATKDNEKKISSKFVDTYQERKFPDVQN